AKPRDFSKKVNRKMYRGAIRSILSELARLERLICVDEFAVGEPKTKVAKALLSDLGVGKALVITDEVTRNAALATRNIPDVDVIAAKDINPHDLVGFEHVIMTKAAVEKVEAWLS
ncbi:MAG TPA: uL4 family ribosomal protein, partial [Gammaproteobacteria bacterium]